jgi:steroid 5-alpha reductase family enzyme
MELSQIFATNLAVIVGTLVLLWLISLRLKDASIVDIFWGLGFVTITWCTFFIARPTSSRYILLAVMVTIWGVRLAGYLAWRNIGKSEDYRYRAMRTKYGDRFPLISLFLVFGLQGVIMLIVSLPVQVTANSINSLNWLDALGVGAWFIGLFFETVGDLQLARFKANPDNQGKVMDRGLWRFTRHPNYFGDFMIWWGVFTIALAGGSVWWTIISPLLMSFLLIRVSGVALLENSLRTRTIGYDNYVRNTSAFFPLPPKKSIHAKSE